MDTADAIGLVLLLAVLAEFGQTVAVGLSEYLSVPQMSANAGLTVMGERITLWEALPAITSWANTTTGTLLLAVLALVVVSRWLLGQESCDVPRRAWALLAGTAAIALLGTCSIVLQAISVFEAGSGWNYLGGQVAVLLLMGCATALALVKLSTRPTGLSDGSRDLDQEEYWNEDGHGPAALDDL